MRFAGFQSNGCLTTKAGILGEVLHVCLKVSDLVKGLQEIGKLSEERKPRNVEAFCDLVEDLDMDAFQRMCRGGAEIFVHKLKPSELIGLPMAWFCFELSVDGAVLICARQGLFLSDLAEAQLTEYKSMIQLFQTCGKNTERYNEVVEVLSKPVATEVVAAGS